ncbi:MAG: 50S ribosome-binding GTPase [Candidatus Heimdallarchaeota archaeon]|nr:50S ribosome-binding GTPase [Candidatus Heimdallarchaeota archaeon]MBY8994068.1 50S ribosome-binding GTPase [Candidatus Heimdallarchaeota archaeon]
MSTNLSPEAKMAEQEYNDATTLDDKIVKLEKFISLVPKHKATEKLVARLRSRLVRYKTELEDKKRRQKSLSKGPTWVIPKEGDAQVSLVGVKNSGKSQLLQILTGSNTKVADYPYTTEKPEPGVLDCGGAIIQLIDLPSIFPNIRIESKNGAMLLSQIRASDLIVFVIDLSGDPKEQMDILIEELYNGSIRVNKEKPPIELRKTGSGGAILIGESKVDATRGEIIEILHDLGIYNFSLKFFKPMTLADVVEALDYSLAYSKGIIIANKGDKTGSKENFQKLKELYEKQFIIIPVSAIEGEGLELLEKTIFDQLDLVRIKSKEPNGEIAKKPIVLKKGATVSDVAKIIHTRFYDHFKQAKIYGPSAKFDGQSVGLNHVLADGDIVEIFAD